MFLILLVMFILVPLAELVVIVEIGSQIGYFYTILTLIIISVTGAALAKRQGYAVVARIRDDIARGRMPGDSLIDGALILAGALLLLTPGYITDTVGLLLLLPPVRKLVCSLTRRRIQRAIERRTVRIWNAGGGDGSGNSANGPGPGKPPSEPEQRRRELED